MKAFCINLDRRPDRMDHMAAQFERQGMAVERIPAVDAQDPAVAAAAAQCKVGFTGRVMGPGAYGCFQSHREFWRRLVASGEAHGMILEDDLVLSDGLATYLADGWVPKDADIVKLETYESRIHLDKGDGVATGPRRLYRLRSRHPGTGCYVISATAAKRLLAQTEGALTDPIDEYLFSEASPAFRALTIYQMMPAPVIQGDRWKGAGAGASWTQTSITQRLAPGEAPGMKRESLWDRVSRRLREELRALRQGTRYAVARHG